MGLFRHPALISTRLISACLISMFPLILLNLSMNLNLSMSLFLSLSLNLNLPSHRLRRRPSWNRNSLGLRMRLSKT